MILRINNKTAAIKQDTSIEYNSINPLFGDREDYTFNIELPLNNKANLEIFGRLDRLDADINDLFYDAEIIDGNFRKSGAVAVTSVTDTMVKVQFLADRSFQNFYPEFDKRYIDELPLPHIPKWIPNNIAEWSGSNDPSEGLANNRNGRTRGHGRDEDDEVEQDSVYKSPDDAWGTSDIIALPWVNAASGNIQNMADYGPRNGTNKYYWHVAASDDYDTETVKRLSCQIRLYTLTQYICEALGYSMEASAWQESEYFYLYSFNCVPAAWDDSRWQDTLPHWSINEFFEELMKLMLCDIKIDHKKKTVSFSWQQSSLGDTVAIEKVVSEHTATVTKEDDSQYKPARNISYADGGHNMAHIYSCPWYFHKYDPKIMSFATMQDIANWMVDPKDARGNSIDIYSGYPFDIVFYAEQEDMYFVMFVTKRFLAYPNKVVDYAKYGNVYRLLPLNAFGTRIIDEENWEDSEEISIIPAWLDDTDKGLLPFFDAGATGDASGMNDEQYRHWEGQSGSTGKTYVEPDQIIQPFHYKYIKNGEQNKKTNYSHLQVAFWYGMSHRTWGNEGELPRPFLTQKEFVTVWGYWNGGPYSNIILNQWQVVLNPGNGSLRLNTSLYGMGAKMDQWIKIDTKKKYEISFLADDLPDVKAVFIIHGKRYLCANIKTEITTDGMSQLKKGTFYRVTS